MKKDEHRLPIKRHEFYSEISFIWLLIMAISSHNVSNKFTAETCYWLASLIGFISSVTQAYLAKKAYRRNSKLTADTTLKPDNTSC